MFRNLLVGVDGSPCAAHALATAIEIARASGGRLGLLGVAGRPSRAIWLALPPFAPPASQARLAARMEADAQRHVDHAARAVPADVPVTRLVLHGSVAAALLEQARTGPWDVIVVGRRTAVDRRSLRRSAGTRLLHASPVPVLVAATSAVEPPPRPPKRSAVTARRRRRRCRAPRRSPAPLGHPSPAVP